METRKSKKTQKTKQLEQSNKTFQNPILCEKKKITQTYTRKKRLSQRIIKSDFA